MRFVHLLHIHPTIYCTCTQPAWQGRFPPVSHGIPMAKPSGKTPCPCGNPLYDTCCKPYIEGSKPAPDARTLMRSRYSAFVVRNEDYLARTWHPETLPEEPILSENDVKWIGLDIKQFTEHDDTHATVEFVARFKVGGRAHRLHEVSQFEIIATPDGQPAWVYVDGTFPGDN